MQDNDQRLHALELQMALQEQKHLVLSTEFEAMRKLIEANNKNLEDFVELGKSLKVGLKLLYYIERIAVWVTKIVAALTLMWGVWEYGVMAALRNSK